MAENKTDPTMHPAIKFAYIIEDGALVAVLLTMIILAVIQIIMRNLFDSSLIWADPVLRIGVLWIGLLGAMIASRHNDHIAIDLISLYISERNKQLLTAFISLFTVAICGLVCYHSYRFVFDEYTYKSIAFGTIPSWIFQIIIPIAFFVIAFRYSILCVFSLLGKLPDKRVEETD